jgi:hypothetical protein
MIIWKLTTSDTYDEYEEDFEDSYFKRKKDAETFSKEKYKKYIRYESQFEENGEVRSLTYQQYLEEFNMKIVPVSVSIDGKLERVILQRKS